MKKKEDSSSSESDSHSSSDEKKSNQNKKDLPKITHAFCICSKCHKLCLVNPDFWNRNSSQTATSQHSHNNYEIFLNKDQKWEYSNNLTSLKQDSFIKDHLLFPCCPNCLNLLIDQIQLNNDFYTTQQDFLNSTESNSTKIKNTYLTNAETKIKNIKQESSSLNEIVEANKKTLKSNKNKETNSPTLQAKKSTFNISEIKEGMKTSSSSRIVSTISVEENSSSDDSSEVKIKKKDDRIQSQSSVTFLIKSPGFCGIALCFSFHITANRHYGCINGNRLGTMTPSRVPTREFDQALFLLAHLVKSIATLAKIDTPNLVISSGVFLYEELKDGARSPAKIKAFTTDAIANRNDGIGKMKLKVKLFEKPKIDNDNENERISLSSLSKSEKRELSGSADSLKPRFFSSEPVQLTANDLKTSRGTQIFKKAISILMSIVYSIFSSPAVSTHFSFPYEIQKGGASINGVSFDYDKQNPGAFTYAMKLLLFDLKSIQAKALEDDVDKISD